MKEEAVLFGATGSSLAGVLTDPGEDAGAAGLPAFVFLNAGVVHRVGPNRLYVRLARALAQRGFPSLRFDYSGIGDSGARTDDLPPAESVMLETREAMDLLERVRGVDRFVPIGICSGATLSFLAALEDERVVACVLINAQGHLHGRNPDVGTALRNRTLTRHFWRIALRSSFRAKNWLKAIRGQLDPVRILRMMVGFPMRAILARRKAPAPKSTVDAAGQLRSATERGVHIFHLYSEGDEGLDYFELVLGKRTGQVADGERSRLEIVRGANHVFTLLWSQEHLVRSVCEWADLLARPPHPSPMSPTGEREPR